MSLTKTPKGVKKEKRRECDRPRLNLACSVCGSIFVGSVSQGKRHRSLTRRGHCRCPECRQKLTREQLRERAREHEREYASRLRRVRSGLKIMLGCVDCGFNAHPDALQFDHVCASGEKQCDVSKAKSFNRLACEVAKCEVVCANCHAIRTAKRRIASNRQQDLY
jgi:hypothetical protein